jgi:hypothetical protein
MLAPGIVVAVETALHATSDYFNTALEPYNKLLLHLPPLTLSLDVLCWQPFVFCLTFACIAFANINSLRRAINFKQSIPAAFFEQQLHSSPTVKTKPPDSF